MQSLHRNFKGLRWSDKLGHCGCPLSLDTYWACTDMKCLYCPAHYDAKFSKCGFNVPTYITHSVRESELRDAWMCILNGYGGSLCEAPGWERYAQFTEYILSKKFIQLGYKTDPFIAEEKDFKITLAMMRFFHHQAQPAMISTKATWWAHDERYLQVLASNPSNWHVKLSISGLDDRAAELEPGAPSPEERLEAAQIISSLGVPVTLWIRPYIPGYSDQFPDAGEMIELAASMGVKAVSVEWLALKRHPSEALKERYDKMGEILEYPIYEHYLEGSGKGRGDLRLTASLKRAEMERMREAAYKNGMLFTVSDVHNKDLSDTLANCCGSSQETQFLFNFHTAAATARSRDISFAHLYPDELKETFGIRPALESGVIPCDKKRRSKFEGMSIYEMLVSMWQDSDGEEGPTEIFKTYGTELAPVGFDEKGYRIYGRRVDEGGPEDISELNQGE